MRNRRLILNIVNCIIITAAYYALSEYFRVSSAAEAISPFVALGFLIVSAYLFGTIASVASLPAITGYLAAGILFGPPVVGLVSDKAVAHLELINALALSFIGITAGGELHIASLKKNFRSITAISAAHTVIIFSCIFLLFSALFKYVPQAALPDVSSALPFALLIATIALANSPATTIAIINEFRARGDFTETVLGVTMLKDALVLIMFGISISVAHAVYTDTVFSMRYLFSVLYQLILSGFAGIVFGAMLILFFKYVAREISVFIVVASFLAHEFAHLAGLEHMLMCMVAGFTVQNMSRQGNLMIEAIEKSHLPIYVVFFSIAGAGLDFSNLGTYSWIVAAFITIRIVLIRVSTACGARLAGSGTTVLKHGWTGFVANAGLAISLVIVVDQSFPRWGATFKNIIISAIAINQIIGPVLFKYGILKSGECRKTP